MIWIYSVSRYLLRLRYGGLYFVCEVDSPFLSRSHLERKNNGDFQCLYYTIRSSALLRITEYCCKDQNHRVKTIVKLCYPVCLLFNGMSLRRYKNKLKTFNADLLSCWRDHKFLFTAITQCGRSLPTMKIKPMLPTDDTILDKRLQFAVWVPSCNQRYCN